MILQKSKVRSRCETNFLFTSNTHFRPSETYQINRVDVRQLRQQLLASNGLLGICLQKQLSAGEKKPKSLVSWKALRKAINPDHPHPLQKGNSTRMAKETKQHFIFSFILYYRHIWTTTINHYKAVLHQNRHTFYHSLHLQESPFPSLLDLLLLIITLGNYKL